MKKLLLIYLLVTYFAFAERPFEPVAIDSRIKTFIYSQNEIYDLKFKIGYNSIIEFSKDEAIDSISFGDPYPWKIQPLGTRLFVKPIEPGVKTNMTVITNKRVYLFEVESDLPTKVDSSDVVHVVRFFYPTSSFDKIDSNQSGVGLKQILQEKATTGNVDGININYSFSGKTNLLTPLEVFDDQKRTYIKLKKEVDYKKLKIFSAKNKIQKTALQFKRTGDFLIVNGVHSSLIFEHEKERVVIYNDKDYI
jgi:type IV secretion system protein VirB9